MTKTYIGKHITIQREGKGPCDGCSLFCLAAIDALDGKGLLNIALFTHLHVGKAKDESTILIKEDGVDARGYATLGSRHNFD